MNRLSLFAVLALVAGCSAVPERMSVEEGKEWTSRKDYTDFEIRGQARTEEGAAAVIRFCQAAEQEG